MTESELISACIKNDKVAKKHFFESYYGAVAQISQRYSKNEPQAEHILMYGFNHIFSNLTTYKTQNKLTLNEFIKRNCIEYAISYIKSIRNEYYVASTIKANENERHTYDLFLDSSLIDFKNINKPIVLKSIQELVPSQRLVFNLFVIDNYDLKTISELLETNEQTIKSNLEKARFNLQKIVEKNLKFSHNEQSV